MKAVSFVVFSIENWEKSITSFFFSFVCNASNRKLLRKHALRPHNISNSFQYKLDGASLTSEGGGGVL